MYDENSNPRHLAAVSPEAIEQQHSELEALERELSRLGKKVGVFTSKGWDLIQGDLVSFWQTIDSNIRSRKAATMQDVEFMRGQLNGLEFLLQLKEHTQERNRVVRQHVETLKQQLE